MSIRNRLYFSAAISIVLVFILGVVIILSSNQITQKSEIQNAAHAMHVTMSEINIITYEYLLHREKRTEQQWNSIYSSTAEILEKTAAEEVVLTKLIFADYAFLGSLFSQVTTNYKERQELIQEGASQKKIDVTLLLEERLVAQLQIKVASIITNATKLDRGAVADLLAVQELTRKLTLILMIVLVFIVTTTSLLVAKSISKPLAEIIKSARIIGKGNIEHKIEFITKDEIGELATSFNEMTNNLKESTTSIENLNSANQQLAANEQQLRAANQQLIQNTIILNKSEKKIQTWIQNSPVSTKIVDLDFNLQFMSASGVRELGIDDINEFYGKPYPFHFYPESFKISMTNNLKKVKETCETITQEASVLDTKGNIVWYHSTIVPVNDEKGKLDYILVVSLETTKRKLAEEETNKKSLELDKQFKESEKQRIAILVVLNDLNITTKDLKAEITERKKKEMKIQEQFSELNKMNKFFVNRENKMIDLKSEINDLLLKLGEAPKYNIPG